ncbi:MAG: hypothetical protein DRP47_10020 [Candidatus Zixiibacteriota bacterium]|nr:MAG: hypothetical protein DRP47_10020 [candidate division Zixibacteria bacterium]
MKPSELIKKFGDISSIPARPILLLGPPGVGKSESVRQLAMHLAKKLDLEFVEWRQGIEVDPAKHFVYVEFRLSGARDVDLLGLPNILANPSAKTFAYRIPEWLAILSNPNQHGMLFLDELTNPATEDVRAVLMQVLGSRRIGFTKIGSKVWIIAAGNKPEHSSLASELASPIINRVRIIEFEAPSVREWINYMTAVYHLTDRSRPILAFLTAKPDYLVTEAVPDSTLTPYPSPRAWTGFVLDIESGLADYADCEQYVGPEAGAAFLAFISYNFDVERALSDLSFFKSLTFDQQLYVVSMASEERLKEWIKDVVEDNDIMEFAISSIRFLSIDARKELVSFLLKKSRSNKLLDEVQEELKEAML